MLLTLVVWVYMFARRIPFLISRGVAGTDSTPAALAQISPPAVANPSDKLKNPFELPVLFYAVVLYLFATSRVDAAYLWAAWIFAAFRALHSAVHCTFNLITLRFWLYLVSALAVWFMIVRAALAAW
jgi:hypothetical protein